MQLTGTKLTSSRARVGPQRRLMCWWRSPRFGVRLGSAAPLVADVIHEHVLAEALRRGEEGAAAVDLRHLLDERRQHRAPLEHEGVDGDALARAALDFLERLLERPPRRRGGELRLAAPHVRRPLPLRGPYDLLH